MTQSPFEVSTAAGPTEAFFFTPESGSGPWPGVLYLTDIGGIRDAYFTMARRLADKGYAVLLPNIFHRISRIPVMDFANFRMGEERSMKRLSELMNALTAVQMAADGTAYVDDLLAMKQVKPGKVGVVGYCFSGAMAMRAAAAVPDKVAAAASFHGGGLVTDQHDSPHLELSKIKARLYFGHAIEDRSMPAEAIQKLDAALKAWGGKYESEVYDGAYHGWAVPGTPVYNEKQAERHFEKLVQLFDATLK